MTDVPFGKQGDQLALRPRGGAASRHTSDQTAATDEDETVIAAGLAARHYLKDLWRYRELFIFLAWRDILVRYKQTVVGIAWSVIRPALTILILVLIFEKLGKMPSGGVPYPLLVLCGLLPWQFFSTALASGGESLVSNAALVSKVYFPRLLVPAGSISAGLVDFLISLALLVALIIWYQWLPPAAIIWLPCFMLLAIAIAFGVGVWVAALMVQYRDVRFIIPFAVQLGLYISPVGFSSSVVPEQYQVLYALNPMVGVIDGFRASILGGEHTLRAYSVIFSVLGAVVLVTAGLAYFRRNERRFAELI
jgi:lipopolysaccharide transport system permease protein